MALIPDTDQFSQFLRLAFLRSPNYAAGSAGWTINQDGSVEFNNGTFRGNIVGGALYIYTGVPGLGNPPQLAIVSSSVTQDPYGNAITSSKILIQANVITETSGIIRTASAAPLIQLDGVHDAEWIYNAAAKMIAAIAAGSGNDGLGNAYPAGVTAFVTITGTFAGNYAVNLNDQAQPFGTTLAALTFHNQTNSENLAPGITGQAHSSAGCNINLQSGKTLAGSAQASVQVQDSVSSSVTGGLVDVIAGKLEVLATDGNVYRTERLSVTNAANVSLSAASFTNVFGGASVAAAAYRVTADLLISVGGTATALIFQLTGPAVAALTSVKWRVSYESGTGESVFAGHSIGNLNSVTLPGGATFPANAVVHVWLSAYVTFSAAGNLNLQVELGTASAGSQVSLGSTMDVFPVG